MEYGGITPVGMPAQLAAAGRRAGDRDRAWRASAPAYAARSCCCPARLLAELPGAEVLDRPGRLSRVNPDRPPRPASSTVETRRHDVGGRGLVVRRGRRPRSLREPPQHRPSRRPTAGDVADAEVRRRRRTHGFRGRSDAEQAGRRPPRRRPTTSAAPCGRCSRGRTSTGPVGAWSISGPSIQSSAASARAATSVHRRRSPGKREQGVRVGRVEAELVRRRESATQDASGSLRR